MPPDSSLQKSLLRYLPAALWGGAILWLSLSAAPPEPPEWLAWDKLRHAGAYALLTGLLGYALKCRPTTRCWLRPVLIASGYGVLMEVLQGTLTSYREASFGDVIANLSGALFCALAALVILRRWYRGGPPS